MLDRLPTFARVESWIFDLDNTLYPPSARLFEQINLRMTDFIERELEVSRAAADEIRARYWRHYGITLKGLIDHHGIDADAFLAEVHDIDLAALSSAPELAEAIRILPGGKIIHTNGPRIHAEAVLKARGLTGLFDAVYTIEDKAFVAKPRVRAYEIVVEQAGIAPDRAAMIEDDVRNLVVPKAMGMATVWIDHGRGGPTPPHVDMRIERLETVLGRQATSHTRSTG